MRGKALLSRRPRIPTGFRPKARGWTASRAYPGWEIPRIHNPNGVAEGGRNPVGVGSNARLTRGSSCLATPGFGSQSLRDWNLSMLALVLAPRFMAREQVIFEQGATREPPLGTSLGNLALTHGPIMAHFMKNARLPESLH